MTSKQRQLFSLPHLLKATWLMVAIAAAVPPPATAQSPCAPAPSGLIGWWRGEADAQDASGTHHGSLQGGLGFASAKVGSGFSFDGLDDYLSVPDSTDWDFGTGDFTIEFWTRLDELKDSMFIHQQSGTGTGGFEFDYQVASGTLIFALSPAGVGISRPWSPAAGVWYHLAVVRNQNVFRLYVNDEPLGTAQANASPLADVSGPLRIGNYAGGTPGEFAVHGLMDDLAIYRQALTVAQIADIYNAGAAGKCVPTCVPPPANLVAWWRGEKNTLDQQGTSSGTAQGSVSYIPGMVGQAFRFDGVSGLLALGNNSPFRQSSQITYSFWVRLPSSAGVNAGGYAMGTAATLGHGYGGITVAPSGITFAWTPLNPGSDTWIYSDGVTLPTDEWVHVAVSMDFDAPARAIYVNGQPVTTTMSQNASDWHPKTTFHNTVEPDSIGGRFVNNWNYFNGDLDEVDVYSRALDAAEVLEIYNAGAAGKCLPCVPPPSGLIAWWRGENNAQDSTGGNHGTLKNGAGYAAGKVGDAFSLDGVDDHVEVPDSPSLNTPNGITLMGWIRHDGGGGAIVSKWDNTASDNSWALLIINSGQLRFTLHGIGHRDTSANVIPIGVLTHLAATYDMATLSLKIFVNGVEVPSSGDTVPTAVPVRDSATPLWLGKRVDGDGSHDYFHGLLDEMDLYDRALDSAQIAAIYNAGSAGKCTLASPTITCPGNITDQSTDPAGKVVTFNAPEASSPNGSVTVVCTPASGSMFPFGITTVNCTATDTANQTASCSFTVTVNNSGGEACPPLAGAVTWWRFDGNLNDSLGANTGTPNGGVSYVSGLNNQAINFNGTDGYAAVPYSDSLMPGVDSYTLEGWFRTTGSGDIFNFNECPGFTDCAASVVAVGVKADGTLVTYLRSSVTGQAGDPYAGQQLDGHRAVADGQWHHFALVRDLGAQRNVLYLDGTEETSVVMNPGSSRRISDQTAFQPPVLLGAGFNTGANTPSSFLMGSIENLVTYHRALTSAEVYTRYRSGLTGDCTPIGTPTITCPANITEQTTDPAGKAVTFAMPAASSPNGSVTVVCTPAAGSVFPVGTTTVSCTATDAASQIAMCSFTVTVNLSPGSPYVYFQNFENDSGLEWSLPGRIRGALELSWSGPRLENGSLTLTLNNLVAATAYVLEFDLYVFDTWDGDDTVNGPDYFNVAIDGTQRFHETFSNSNGEPPDHPQSFPGAPEGGRRLIAFSSTAVDAIYRKIQIPFIAGGASATITFSGQGLEPSPNETWSIDNVGVRRTLNLTPASSSVLPGGVVNFTATGGSGRLSYAIVQNNSGGTINASTGEYHAGNQCGVTDTIRVTDANNQTADATVTIVDTVAPMITACASTLILPVAANCQAALPDLTSEVTATDACGAPIIAQTPAAGTLLVSGTHTVTLRATDAAGNASTCDVIVTVADTTPPVIACPANIVAQSTGPAGASVNFSVSASDACTVTPSLSCNPPSGSTFPIGSATVNCTATDDAGNMATCSFTVTVNSSAGGICPPTDAVAWYRADGNTLDSIGGHDGFFTGEGPYYSSGGHGGGQTFGQSFWTAADDGLFTEARKVHVPATDPSTALDFSGSSFTWELWALPNWVDGDPIVMEQGGDFSTEPGYPNSGIRIRLFQDIRDSFYRFATVAAYIDSSNPSVVSVPGAVGSLQWNHIVFVLDHAANQARLYVNGTLVGSAVETRTPTLSFFRDLMIGGPVLANAAFGFNGFMDEVVLYKRALTDSEVRARYTCGQTISCPPPTSGLLSWWRGENNTLDQLGNNDGTPFVLVAAGTPLPLTYWNGRSERAFDFADSHYVQAQRQVQNDFTLAAWMKSDVASRTGSQFWQGDGFIYADAPGANYDFGTAILNGKFAFGIGQPGQPDQTIQSSTTVNSGEWTHVAAVRSGTVIKVYINGIEEATRDTGISAPLNAQPLLYLGGNVADRRFYTGLMDEVLVYGRALTAREILGIYQCNTLPSPTISCPGNITQTDPPGNVVSFDPPAASSPNGAVTVVCTPASGSVFPIGTTTVNCTATDTANQIATCSFTITVNSVLSINPSSVTVAPSGSVNFSATGGSGQLTYSILQNSSGGTIDPSSGEYHAGNQCGVTDTIRVTDTANRTADATVEILDGTPPTITCPPDFAVECTGPNGAIVTFNVTATDDCAGVTGVSCIPSSGSLFAPGVTRVDCTATDPGGKTSTCWFTVVVRDTIAPTITACPADRTIPAEANCRALIPDLTGEVITLSDACGPVVVTQQPPAGASGAPGTYIVFLRAADVTGNFAICMVTITIADTTPPVITTCAPVQRVEAGANCQGLVPDLRGLVSATDNCGDVLVSQEPPPGALRALGLHSIMLTITDTAGNTATCAAELRIEDTTRPVITACPPGEVTLTTSGVTCLAAMPDFTTQVAATDPCGPVEISQLPAAGSIWPPSTGPIPILVSVRDGAGNTAICRVNVSVIKGLPEIIVCPPNQTLTADASGGAQLPDLSRIGQALDSCHSSESPLLLPLSQSPAPGTRLGIGTHTVTFTATSDDGRTATCSALVTVRRVSYSISGRIARSGNGVAVPDVLVRLIYSRNSRTTARTTRTDSTGRFGFGDVPRGASGVFYPLSSSFRFNPSYRRIQNLNDDVTGDFTARSLVGASPIPDVGFVAAGEEPPLEGIPLIGGLLIDTNGLALAEVGVELSGDDHRTTNTSATGEFLFDFLPMNGTFTLRPEVGDRIFDPASLAVSNLVGAEFAVFVEQPLEPLPMPVLSMRLDARFDGRLTITWSGGALDYILESTPSLSDPGWQSAGEQQLQDIGQVIVPLESTLERRFFRLRAP
jgi:hypothetical protein